MLAAAHRLRRSNDFAAAVRGGRRVGRGGVVVHVTVPDQHDVEPALGAEFTLPPRAGFVVSKAVGNAVVRNKVKRRLRHLVSERLHTLPAGATLVVRAQPSAALRSYAELASDMDAALTVARSPRRPRPKGVR